MSQFEWTTKRSNAARSLADGMSHTETAKACDITTRTLYRWLADPEFAEEVDRLTLTTSIATRAERIRIAHRAVRQRLANDGTITTKSDILEWLKFIQSETDGSKSDIADKLAALFADRMGAF